MSFDAKPFNFIIEVGTWIGVVGAVLGLVFLVLLLTSVFTYGTSGPGRLLRLIGDSVRDWFGISWGRVAALTMLTFREAMRRKTFAIGVIFILLIMFAGWFMGNDTVRADMQVKRYVSFVLTAISWLIIPVVLLLSCWGVPEDIKARSMHTVVTKPVRRNEIVLGRVFGFGLIGTLALLIMSVSGYIWIDRNLTEGSRDFLTARVPVYGKLSWLDQGGNDARVGINVGDLWSYRSFITGNSKSRAIWEFEDIDENSLRINANGEQELHLESTFHVFRSHKGDLERGILSRMTFINESSDLRVSLAPFEVKEFRTGANVAKIPRTLTKGKSEKVDLLDDLVDDGKLRVEVECLNGGQYLGMARPDLFVRLPERSFLVSYSKAILGVWLMMATTVVLGVTFSCIVKGPVATLATGVVLVIGKSFWGFMETMSQGEGEGGGALESAVRLYQHLNQQVEIQEGVGRTVFESVDSVFTGIIWVSVHLIPDFSKFDLTEYVANGFDVPFSAALLPAMATAVGYTVPWIVFAYFALKYRELESK